MNLGMQAVCRNEDDLTFGASCSFCLFLCVNSICSDCLVSDQASDTVHNLIVSQPCTLTASLQLQGFVMMNVQLLNSLNVECDWRSGLICYHRTTDHDGAHIYTHTTNASHIAGFGRQKGSVKQVCCIVWSHGVKDGIESSHACRHWTPRCSTGSPYDPRIFR